MVASAVALLKASREKEQIKMDAVFAKAYPGVLSVCFGILRDATAAEDAAQKTFLRAWDKLDGFRGDANIQTWLHRIAVRVCLSELRGPAVKHPQQFEEIEIEDGEVLNTENLLPSQSSASSESVRREFREHFAICLGKLRVEYREMIHARCIMGLSQRAASDYLGLPVSTVKVRSFRALSKLRGELKRVGYHKSRDLL